MSEHTDVAAYAFGLLEPADRQAFEEHLATCPACAAELAELSGMKDLLTGLDPVPSAAGEPTEAEVVDLVRRRAADQRHRARWRVALSAAAAVALLAGGVAVGRAVTSQPPPGVPAISNPITRQDPATGVIGTVSLVKKPFGTQVTLDLAKIRGPKECQMVAVSKTGQRFVIATWFLPPVEFGGPKHPAHLRLVGWTTIKTSDLSRIDVNLVSGGTLVSIPVPATS